ncbi:MAG: methyltransferase domain-containing protein [Planctomycetes bacterium]|nr:methyltransferase domain-containing protein [Planctomycetota bacterium]
MADLHAAPPPEGGLPAWAVPRPLPPRIPELAEADLRRLAAAVAWRVAEPPPGGLPASALKACCDLHDVLTVCLDVHDNRWSPRRYADLFATYGTPIEAHGRELRGATVVDLGCGVVNPLGFGFLLLMLGARRCLAIEESPLANPARAARGLADLAASMLVDPAAIVGDRPIDRAELLANVASFDLARLTRGDLGGVDDARLRFAQTTGARMPLADGEADIVISQAVLEHVRELDDVLAEAARVTAPGGLGIHVIDATDHRAYEDPAVHPLDYLRAELQGEFLTLDLGDFRYHQNRLRPCQFPDRFAAHGFATLSLVPLRTVPVDAARRESFAEPFRALGLDDLAAGVALLVVRRDG